MSEAPAVDAWTRLADVRLQLLPSVQMRRHDYRGEPWYVAHDASSGRSLRLSPEAHRIALEFDGRRTLASVAADLGVDAEVDSEERQDVLRTAQSLLASEFVQADSAASLSEMIWRQRRTRRARLAGMWRSPLAVRLPLLDPDPWLERSLRWIRPAFTAPGFALWLAVIAAGLVTAALHWEGLTENVTDRVLATENLLLLAFVFPVVKAIHELGHAYATKVWGGEVHEIGIMLIVFFPIPYVDASAASAFPEKHRRAIVGAAGMGVELFVAALALLLWASLEPGLLRSIAYNAILIASVSTLLFNANPLLRFDGYYILADAIEMPNLAGRSSRYLGYLIHRHGFGVDDPEPPVQGQRERAWLVFYAIASFVYRMIVLFGIILFIASKYFFIGVVLAIWASIGLLAWPLAKQVRELLVGRRVEARRARAIGVTSGAAFALLLLLGIVPMPLRTVAEGVVWFPEDAVVRASADGFAAGLLVAPGSRVEVGDPLIELRSAELDAEVRGLAAKLLEEQVRYAADQVADRARADLTHEAVEFLSQRLARARERKAELVVRSPAAGHFVVPDAADLEGRFVTRGEVVGFVVREAELSARVVVDADQVDLVRRSTRDVQVRLSQQLSRVLPARLAREIPAATRELPSAALGLEGGGELALDPSDPDMSRAFEHLFLFELEIDPPPGPVAWGQRVHVRFDHGASPLAVQWYRSLRQLFLTRLHV